MWSGVALTAFSAVGFASKGVFAKYLYADGWSVDALLLARSLLSLPIIGLWALWQTGPYELLHAPRAAIFGAMAAGLLCYYGGAMLDFYALTLIGVGIERVLIFAYPTMVVLLYSLLYRSWPQPRVVAALAVTFFGIVMVVTGLDMHVLRGNLAGAGLVLMAAVTFAIYYLAGDRWTPSLGSIGFTAYAQASATAGIVTHVTARALLRHQAVGLHGAGRDVLLMGGLVVVATVLPMLSMAEGVKRLGAERASVVSTVGPPTTILLGAWLLGETLSAAQWLGVALIAAGILILELVRPQAREPQSVASLR